MSTILRIFIKDLRGICRNIFALIIAIGLCIIPSLYAWFNIYSNWDPYANTASIKIAVYSEDTGFDMDGEYQNMGNSIIDNLKENDKLGWTFTKDMESTIDGVKSGKYYAAIVIGDNFSRSMLNFLNDNMETLLLHIMRMPRRTLLPARLHNLESLLYRKLLMKHLLKQL